VSTDTSQPTPEQIDSVISAEIPDPIADPLAYALVAEHMMHGPCGKLNPNSPCMKMEGVQRIILNLFMIKL
jgi:hypothetical protein